MEMSKNEVIKYAVYFLVCIFIIVLCLLFGGGNKNIKLYKQFDYVYDKDLGYSKGVSVSNLPVVNLSSDAVLDVNKEITNKYYEIVLDETGEFYYSYQIYDDFLSLLITTNRYDESEYGNISYNSYNIRLSDGYVYNNGEVLSLLNLNQEDVLKKIDERINEYYKIDSLSNTMSFSEYKNKVLGDNDFVYAIKDDTLYAYKVINYTQDIVHDYNGGNIYEFKIRNLK